MQLPHQDGMTCGETGIIDPPHVKNTEYGPYGVFIQSGPRVDRSRQNCLDGNAHQLSFSL